MSFEFEPIGVYTSKQKHKIESPRQGVLSYTQGFINLKPHLNFEQALDDLHEFERIWLIYSFHLNKHWKPKVSPPISDEKNKVGVFSTRSPYRPNSIGLSCVKLISIDGLKILVSESDLLDQTPIFDIKPYLPYADSFEDATVGWPNRQSSQAYTFEYHELFKEQLDYLNNHCPLDFLAFLQAQLTHQPKNLKKKRITLISPSQNLYIIAYRTWRIHYQISDPNIINFLHISSGYESHELASPEDPYEDKNIHKKFKKKFNC